MVTNSPLSAAVFRRQCRYYTTVSSEMQNFFHGDGRIAFPGRGAQGCFHAKGADPRAAQRQGKPLVQRHPEPLETVPGALGSVLVVGGSDKSHLAEGGGIVPHDIVDIGDNLLGGNAVADR